MHLLMDDLVPNVPGGSVMRESILTCSAISTSPSLLTGRLDLEILADSVPCKTAIQSMWTSWQVFAGSMFVISPSAVLWGQQLQDGSPIKLRWQCCGGITRDLHFPLVSSC